MKKIVNDSRLMIKVCDLFYNHDMNQMEISKQLGLSRPTVARILASAREQGVVQIIIPELDTVTYWELEQQLEDKYNLKDVLVVDCLDEKPGHLLGKAAAGYLKYILEDGCTIGVSMGSSMYEVVENIPDKLVSEVTVIPLVGGMGKLRTELHANRLAEKLAQKLDGNCISIHAPARVSSKVALRELMKEESISTVVELMPKVDVALVGIGYPNDESAIKATGYYKANEIESLIKRGVAGEMCMQFYDTEGNTAAYRKDNNVIGIDIHKLKKVPNVIAVAGGIAKLSAIQGAIRGKYIKTLITDLSCAKALLDM